MRISHKYKTQIGLVLITLLLQVAYLGLFLDLCVMEVACGSIGGVTLIPILLPIVMIKVFITMTRSCAQIILFGTTCLVIWIRMKEKDVQEKIKIAFILNTISNREEHVKISQIESLRWRSLVQTLQIIFAGSLVTAQDLTAQPAPTQHTSNVLNLNNVCILN